MMMTLMAFDQINFSDIDEEYKLFEEKFKPKKTTDDCYTPDNIFEAIADWACAEYGFSKDQIVRPFYPGGDYRRFDYPEGCVVLDNPPFSILQEIINFYSDKIKFFLFAPALTSLREGFCSVCVGVRITYENGAKVPTSFLTNMDDCVARTAPTLFNAIKRENDKNTKVSKPLPKYSMPNEVVTAALLQKWSSYGVELKIEKKDAMFIRKLDCLKPNIFGGAYLLSRAAAQAAARAESQAAARAAAQAAARAESQAAAAQKLELSERERELVHLLSGGA